MLGSCFGSKNKIEQCTVFLQLWDRVFSFQNNLKNLGLSYKTHLDLWDCFGIRTRFIANFYRTELFVDIIERAKPHLITE